jgi:hypothetical protein
MKGWRSARAARPWIPGSAPYLRYVVLVQTIPDSKHATWDPWQTNTLDETALSDAGASLHGIYLDLSTLPVAERVELGRLLSQRSKRQVIDDTAREQELLAKVPRVGQLPGGYDIDMADPADSARVAELVKGIEAKRGVVLRESWSGGEGRAKRHLEWGPVEAPGHVDAMRAGLGRAISVAIEAGLVPKRLPSGQVDRRAWCFPDDPEGKRGSLDLGNLNRSRFKRGAMFRALGGLYKDRKSRKTLVAGSPLQGSPFTLAMIEDGLKFADTHYRTDDYSSPSLHQVAPKSFRPAPVIPRGEQDLGLVADLVSEWYREGRGHQLRLALGGTLLRSGLVTMAGAEQVLLATTARGYDSRGQAYDTTGDARSTVIATAARLRNQFMRTAGANSLRAEVGTPAILDLVMALRECLGEYLLNVWDKIAPKKKNDPDSVKACAKALEERAAAVDASNTTNDKAKINERENLYRMRHRLMASTICANGRAANGRCPCCNKFRCKKLLECGDPSCPPCTLRRIRDTIDLLPLPKLCTVVTRGGYTSKKDAARAYKKLPRHGQKRPRPLYAITPDGSWELTLIADEADGGACSSAGVIGNEDGGVIKRNQNPPQVRNAITRVFLLRHATARQALERQDARSIDLLVESYRKHTTSGHDLSIGWPTKEQIREHRKLEAMKRERTPEELAEECACPPEVVAANPPTYEVVNTETGEVIVGDLDRPPTLAQVAAHEAGERVRLSRRRRFGRRSTARRE